MKMKFVNAPKLEIELEPENLGKVINYFVDELTQTKFVDENGRLSNKIDIVSVDCRDKFKDYKVSDFYMENVIAAGAVDNLKYGQFSDTNIDGVLEQLDKNIEE